jgi:uncharacterized protein (TIGR02145 family)
MFSHLSESHFNPKPMKFFLITTLVLSAFFSAAQSVIDIDGNEYKSVKINSQEWMAENLNVSHFLNGDLIPEAKTAEEWEKAGKAGLPAWCYYNNDPSNNKNGKLYNFYAINDPRGLAPKGWQIPQNINWSKLISYLGTVDIAGLKLKSTAGWKSDGKGNNLSGFQALPSGYRLANGTFNDINDKGQWWSTSTDIGDITQVYTLMLINSSVEAIFAKSPKGNGLSVRCIKD